MCFVASSVNTELFPILQEVFWRSTEGLLWQFCSFLVPTTQSRKDGTGEMYLIQQPTHDNPNCSVWVRTGCVKLWERAIPHFSKGAAITAHSWFSLGYTGAFFQVHRNGWVWAQLPLGYISTCKNKALERWLHLVPSAMELPGSAKTSLFCSFPIRSSPGNTISILQLLSQEYKHQQCSAASIHQATGQCLEQEVSHLQQFGFGLFSQSSSLEWLFHCDYAALSVSSSVLTVVEEIR